MKTTIIATISANGKILVADNKNHQAPQEVYNFFIEKIQSAGNVIMGSTTYKLFTEVFGFSDMLSKLDVVVLSSNFESNARVSVASKPKEALQILEDKNYDEAIVLGGVKVYNSFINEGLFDTLYLTLVPIIIGDGGDIVTAENLFISVQKLEWEKATDNTLRVILHK